MKSIIPIVIFICFCFVITSCSVDKKIRYFQDIPDSGELKEVQTVNFVEPQVQKDDILSITIETIDPQMTSVLNQVPTQPITGVNSALGGQQPSGVSGYLVDKNGDVEIPLMGKVQVAGLTTSEVREKIRVIASKYLKYPTVQVRFANYKVTVLGEVAKPGIFVMPNEQVSVLDAIGAAGDLSIFGKRENILIVRNDGGKKIFGRINLNKTDVMKSQFYYLKQNDIVYVESKDSHIAVTNSARTQTITVIVAILSFLVAVSSKL